MNGETLRRNVVINNPQGFHMRPLTAFVELVRKFKEKGLHTVHLYKDGERRDGTSPLELMTLGADQGTELILEVTGQDALAALDALAELISRDAPE